MSSSATDRARGLRPEVTGFEVVVATASNGAAENITGRATATSPYLLRPCRVRRRGRPPLQVDQPGDGPAGGLPHQRG